MVSLYDRRGFDWMLKLNLVALPLSFVLLFVGPWQLALSTVLLLCVSFITLESLSRRPDNNPITFLRFCKGADRARPVLLCLGDSLTHGTVSSSFTPHIPYKLTQELGLELSNYGETFSDPLWVVNAGQNCITSNVVLERLNATLQTYPDFVLVLIGTNDVQCMCGGGFGWHIQQANALDQTPTMDTLQANVRGILKYIHRVSPQTHIGLCTLPPLGEDLRSSSNRMIQEANHRIRTIAETCVQQKIDKVTLLDLYGRLETILEKERSLFSLPHSLRLLAMMIVHPLYHVFFCSYNLSSRLLFGYKVLCDGLHLNDRGREVVVELIVEWLVAKNVAKAIAVKR